MMLTSTMLELLVRQIELKNDRQESSMLITNLVLSFHQIKRDTVQRGIELRSGTFRMCPAGVCTSLAATAHRGW